MEFLYLLLEGRRLEDVVSTQALERLAPDREAEREVLRHVCAAHDAGTVTDPTDGLVKLGDFAICIA